MSIPREPEPAQLFMGILYSDVDAYKKAIIELEWVYGYMDFLSEPRVFKETCYYNNEMGTPIFRTYGTFEKLVHQDVLVNVKLFTNNLEHKLAVNGKRRVNLDPGVMSEERLVLATGKNYTHRVYLSHGIYADLTLIFQRGEYCPLPWTYPDYRDSRLRHFLGVLRQKLILRRKGTFPSKPYIITSLETL